LLSCLIGMHWRSCEIVRLTNGRKRAPNAQFSGIAHFRLTCLPQARGTGDVATCDGVGGVEGPPSPPVVGIRVAPEVLEVPPAAPEVPVFAQLIIPDPQREAELYSRFLVNTIGENPTLRRITDTISVQNEIERLIEAALVHSGFNPTRILHNRHRIRGIVFYPRGRALSLRQYRSHLQSIYRLGTRDTRAFQRLMTAVRNYDLWL
jgi:hypothetical protein